nr:cullin-1-like [Tanacetum cinerariifolium]
MCNVNGKFDRKTIDLILRTYWASALLLFNASGSQVHCGTYSTITDLQRYTVDESILFAFFQSGKAAEIKQDAAKSIRWMHFDMNSKEQWTLIILMKRWKRICLTELQEESRLQAFLKKDQSIAKGAPQTYRLSGPEYVCI